MDRGEIDMMKWKKLVALASAAVLSAALFTGCGGQQQAATSSSGSGSGAGDKIVVGLDDNFPPMGFKDENNEIVGFDIDLAKEATKRLGREVEFKAIDWSSKEAELKSGRVNGQAQGEHAVLRPVYGQPPDHLCEEGRDGHHG